MQNPELNTTRAVAREECRALLRSVKSVSSAHQHFTAVRYYYGLFPDDCDVAYAYAWVREHLRDNEDMLELWKGLGQRFPDDVRPIRFEVRWLVRQGRYGEAKTRIDSFCPADHPEKARRLDRCNLFTEMRDSDIAVAEFDRLIVEHPGDDVLRLQYGRRLQGWGYTHKARQVLSPLGGKKGLSEASAALIASNATDLAPLDRLVPHHVNSVEPTDVLALEFLISEFAGRKCRPTQAATLGNIVLLTGTLGPGGAERQFVNTAVRLEKARRESTPVNGTSVVGTVRIAVKSLSPTNDCNFYLRTVLGAGIPTCQIDTLPVDSPASLDLPGHHLGDLAHLLPSQSLEGLTRLTRYFRENATEIAYLWQDGCILMCALAALYAEVPKIVLNLRGQPPNVRRHIYLPEYRAMYCALARVPGVSFISNSLASARQYAEWLDLPVDRITVIPNGVEPLSSEGNVLEEALWASFEANTAGATRTIGGVFRHNIDKRPSYWIDMAKAVLERDPRARLVLVGSGPLSQEVKKQITVANIVDRVLLVGRSGNVGFWMKKFDVIVSMSKFEGLPNVLIEAQFMGVPVVSTNAGGSVETFLEGQTGTAIHVEEGQKLSAVADAVIAVADWRIRQPFISEMISTLANRRFSVQRMIDQTAKVLSASQ